MSSIFQDKENIRIGLPAPHKGGVVPKTPFGRSGDIGNSHHTTKTPFGKSKTSTNILLAGGDKTTKFDKSKFVTPTGKRVPLGGKDTNVGTSMTIALKQKQQLNHDLLQPKSSSKQSSSGRSRQRHTQSSLKFDNVLSNKQKAEYAVLADDIPDIEYMAPKADELPFIPDGFDALNMDVLRESLNSNIIAQYHKPNNTAHTYEDRLEKLFDPMADGYQLNLPDDDFLKDPEFEEELAL
ncbi:hypothetical protein V1511DRAFT_486162 [Dipodascopsis uninucleata]